MKKVRKKQLKRKPKISRLVSIKDLREELKAPPQPQRLEDLGEPQPEELERT